MTNPALDDLPLVLLHPEARVPEFARADDAGADLATVEAFSLAPGERHLVPTGIGMALPTGWAAFVHPRSGLAVRSGVTVLNAPGTIDAGYRGEIKVPLINLDPRETAEFQVGDRIAQLVIQRVETPRFSIGEALPESERGARGFGSTGGFAPGS